MSDTALTASLCVSASHPQAVLLQAHSQGKRADTPEKDQQESSGDSVRISGQGLALAAGLAAAAEPQADAQDAVAENGPGGQAEENAGSGSGNSTKQSNSIEKKIKNLEEQVDEVKNDDSLSDQERTDQVLTLQTQIARLEIQLRTLEARNSPEVSAGMTAAETYGAMT